MNKDEIQEKIKELQLIIAQYDNGFGALEKELFQAISDYQKALDQAKVKELKESLNT